MVVGSKWIQGVGALVVVGVAAIAGVWFLATGDDAAAADVNVIRADGSAVVASRSVAVEAAATELNRNIELPAEKPDGDSRLRNVRLGQEPFPGAGAAWAMFEFGDTDGALTMTVRLFNAKVHSEPPAQADGSFLLASGRTAYVVRGAGVGVVFFLIDDEGTGSIEVSLPANLSDQRSREILESIESE